MDAPPEDPLLVRLRDTLSRYLELLCNCTDACDANLPFVPIIDCIGLVLSEHGQPARDAFTCQADALERTAACLRRDCSDVCGDDAVFTDCGALPPGVGEVLSECLNRALSAR